MTIGQNDIWTVNVDRDFIFFFMMKFTDFEGRSLYLTNHDYKEGWTWLIWIFIYFLKTLRSLNSESLPNAEMKLKQMLNKEK